MTKNVLIVSISSMDSTSGTHRPTEKQRVIVTGCTGYVGRHVIEHLHKNYDTTYEVIAFIRSTTYDEQLQSKNEDDELFSTIKTERIDYNDASNVNEVIKKYRNNVDSIIHLGFNMDFFPKNKGQYLESNYQTSEHLIDAVLKYEMKVKFIFISTTETIGFTTDSNEILNETNELNPNSIYADSKLQCETLFKRKCSKQSNVKLIILKPTGIYGYKERFFFWQVLTYIASGLSIVLPSPMNGNIMFTHIEDVIQSIVLVLLKSNNDVLSNGDCFIVCPDHNAKLTYSQIICIVADKLSSVHYPLFHLPLFVGLFFIGLLHPLLNLQYDRVFLYHPHTLEETVKHRWYDNSKIKSALGFRPKYSMQQGIEKVVQQEIDSGNLQPSLFARIAYHLF